jgi:hypothetical protein
MSKRASSLVEQLDRNAKMQRLAKAGPVRSEAPIGMAPRPSPKDVSEELRVSITTMMDVEARPHNIFLDSFTTIVSDEHADNIILTDDREKAKSTDSLQGVHWKVGELHNRGVYKSDHESNPCYTFYMEDGKGSGWYMASRIVLQKNSKDDTIFHAWAKETEQCVVPFIKWHCPYWASKSSPGIVLAPTHSIMWQRLSAALESSEPTSAEWKDALTLSPQSPADDDDKTKDDEEKIADDEDKFNDDDEAKRKLMPNPKWGAKGWIGDNNVSEDTTMWQGQASSSEKWYSHEYKKNLTGWFNKAVKLAAAVSAGEDEVTLKLINAYKPQKHQQGGSFEQAMNKVISDSSYLEGVKLIAP